MASSPIENENSSVPNKQVVARFLFGLPWWLLILFFAGLLLVSLVRSDENYANTFNYVRDGVGITIFVTAVAYPSAMVIALVIGIIRAYPPKPGRGVLGMLASIGRLFLYQAATLYVEVIRGLPILVTLIIVSFIIVNALREYLVQFGIVIPPRQFLQSAIVALAVVYGAFSSETFRAGIQSIERGQLEAARSLGMTRGQVIRLIVLPQAIRRIIPPLGNDLVAMIKDTSLVAFLAVQDVTYLARQWASNQFQFVEAYSILAMIYLSLTVSGSIIVRWVERWLAIPGR
jgi:polar amino acid transport system permease protein